MPNFRGIKSPAALATCGMFLVPEPFGACLLLAAAVWWLWRKAGCPCRSMVSSFWEAVRRVLHLPGADSPGGVFGEEVAGIARRPQQLGFRQDSLRLGDHVGGRVLSALDMVMRPCFYLRPLHRAAPIMPPNFGDRTMAIDERRSNEGRRSGKDRRSGVDTRTKEEKGRILERRTMIDRRSRLDRRSNVKSA
jgi:hypothetical protein